MKQNRWMFIATLILLIASFLAGCGVQAQTRTNSTEALIERVAALETEVADLKAGSATPGKLAMVASTSTVPPTATETATAAATPTETATPSPTAEAGPFFEIVSINSRITESNNIWWKFAWLLTLRDISSSRLLLNAEIKFLDADGFIIDHANLDQITLAPFQTQDFSDFILIDVAVAPKIASVVANVEIVERTPVPGATAPATATTSAGGVTPTVGSEVVSPTLASETVTPTIEATRIETANIEPGTAESLPAETATITPALAAATSTPSANNVLALLVPTPTPAADVHPATALQSAAARYNRNFVGDAQPSLPAANDEDFDVILLQRDDHTLSLLLRNNSAAPLYQLNVDAVARAADGGMLGVAESNSGSPRLVYPGEVSYVTLSFGDLLLPAGAQFDFEVHGDPAAENVSYGDLTITEVNLVQERYVGMAKNNSAQQVSLMQALLLCFDDTGAFVAAHSNLTPKNAAPPGVVIPFQVELKGDNCPTYWLGVAGLSH